MTISFKQTGKHVFLLLKSIFIDKIFVLFLQHATEDFQGDLFIDNLYLSVQLNKDLHEIYNHQNSSTRSLEKMRLIHYRHDMSC